MQVGDRVRVIAPGSAFYEIEGTVVQLGADLSLPLSILVELDANSPACNFSLHELDDLSAGTPEPLSCHFGGCPNTHTDEGERMCSKHRWAW